MKKLVAATALCMLLPSLSFADVIADSVADFSDSQAGPWSNGFYNQTQDSDGTYATGDFESFEGPDWTWTGAAWDWGDGNVPWTTIGNESGHPNGDNNGDVHHAVRRWVSPVSGDADITFNIAKQNVNCGNGTSVILYQNGDDVSSLTIAGTDGVGLSETASLTLAAGDIIDLALTPMGADGSNADGCDGSFFGMTVDAVPEPGAMNLLFLSLLLVPALRRKK